MTMDQTVEKTVDRLSELLDRANKAAQDFEVKDRLSDAVAALRRTRLTQDDDAGVERFVTGLLIGVAVGFGLALLLAPKSGEEMRDELMARGSELSRGQHRDARPRRAGTCSGAGVGVCCPAPPPGGGGGVGRLDNSGLGT